MKNKTDIFLDKEKYDKEIKNRIGIHKIEIEMYKSGSVFYDSHRMHRCLLEDIKYLASEAYKEILRSKKRFTSIEVGECIDANVRQFFPTYKTETDGLELGCMQGNIDINKMKKLFATGAEAVLSESCEDFKHEHEKALKQNTRAKITLIGAIIGGVAGFMTLIETIWPKVIELFLGIWHMVAVG